jgi:hypothetical protein
MSALRRPKSSRTYAISIFAGRLSIQSEFSFQTPEFNGRPEHRCYFPVGTRAQLDDPISRAAAIRFWQWASRTEVPNDEDEILSGSAAARIVTFYASYASGRNARKRNSAPANVQVLGPRGRGAAFERCLHDRPRPQPMRRANVSLWKSWPARARQECVLTSTGARVLRQIASHPSVGRQRCSVNYNLWQRVTYVRFAPKLPLVKI